MFITSPAPEKYRCFPHGIRKRQAEGKKTNQEKWGEIEKRVEDRRCGAKVNR
jgi:hypothetical protein